MMKRPSRDQPDSLEEPKEWADETGAVWTLEQTQFDKNGVGWRWSGGFTTEYTGVEQPLYSRTDLQVNDVPLAAVRAIFGSMVPGPKPQLIHPDSRAAKLLDALEEVLQGEHKINCIDALGAADCGCGDLLTFQQDLWDYFEDNAREELDRK
jgi:hypothetical protein